MNHANYEIKIICQNSVQFYGKNIKDLNHAWKTYHFHCIDKYFGYLIASNVKKGEMRYKLNY